ncbi:DUF4491 family protein [Leadbettera azotonutricia]|uniref:DUF4491 family protein n=1 Tax=Leadbettera azotonutricia TaxID=150829 RepID=UPI0005C79171|nr:DUF4491 family protein [Leadbettera azotonutricia]
MHIHGIIIGIIAFVMIGIFHPIIIYGEYHFGTKIWPLFFIMGVFLCIISLFVDQIMISATMGITAFCCFWSIHELFQQRKRVERGWFPSKAAHHEKPIRSDPLLRTEQPEEKE